MQSGMGLAAWMAFQVAGQSRDPNYPWPANTVGRPPVLSQKQPWPQLCHLWREVPTRADAVRPAMKEAGALPFGDFRPPRRVDRFPRQYGLLRAAGWLFLACSHVRYQLSPFGVPLCLPRAFRI